MTIAFTLDGEAVTAAPDETIWQVARRLGRDIPHICHLPTPGYRPDGNCRACVVEIAGERVLAAACIRRPTPGMAVATTSARAERARRTVMELLLADRPARADAPAPDAPLWRWAERVGAVAGRFDRQDSPTTDHGDGHAVRCPREDVSHPAIAVALDLCVACGLCARACREIQVNDVIGMGFRGMATVPVFDQADPMGLSTCVACGECVQACPTGALIEKTRLAARDQPVERQVDTLCPFCGVGCQTRVTVAGGRITAVDGRDGPANQNRLCVKGRFGHDYASHPHRLTVPLVRRADAPKSADVRIDPANPWTHFREAGWDEALELAAGGLARVRDRDGPGALAGFGSAKGSNEEAYLFQKLVRLGFGGNNVDHCTRLCHASSVAALLEGIGSAAVTAPFTAAADADCLFVIGARPTENHPVAATYLKQAVKRGATLIVADPRGHGLMRHATHALRFKGGADVALLDAMLNVVIAEGLTDAAFIAAHVDGFEALARAVAPFTPEATAPITGIAPELVRTAARAYATSRASIIFWGMGVSQHVHGTDNARCLIALAMVTGQIGRPGTGLHPLRGQNNVQGASDAGLIPMVFPDYVPVDDPDARRRFEELWGRPLNPKRGLTVVEIMHAAAAGRIKAMYVMGENPAMSDPDLAHVREALAKLEHLVVQDIFLTETAWHADVVLPASAHAEKLGTYTNTNRQVQIGRPVIAPPGAARQDLAIIGDMARGLGLDWAPPTVEAVYEEMRRAMPSLAGLPWSRLARDGVATYPADDVEHPGHDILFGDGFPTKNGRARLVPAVPTPPDEAPDADYPFLLTTGRLLEHWHTGAMTRRASMLDALEPIAVAGVNPDDARRLGVAAGAPVTVASRRGRITARVRIDPELAPGTVFLPFAFVEAAANLLTNPALDPFGKIPEFKLCAVKLAVAEAPLADAGRSDTTGGARV